MSKEKKSTSSAPAPKRKHKKGPAKPAAAPVAAWPQEYSGVEVFLHPVFNEDGSLKTVIPHPYPVFADEKTSEGFLSRARLLAAYSLSAHGDVSVWVTAKDIHITSFRNETGWTISSDGYFNDAKLLQDILARGQKALDAKYHREAVEAAQGLRPVCKAPKVTFYFEG